MKPRTRQLAKDLLPPVVARKLRTLRAGSPPDGGDGRGARTPLAPGTEADADWYDTSFLSDRGEHYKRPYWELNWYAALTLVADRIMQVDEPRVIDMGCGPAPLALILRDRGVKHYLGFDFSPARLEFARSRLPEYRFELADVYETDLFDKEDYNVAVGTEFLEHLDRDLFVLDRIRPGTRVLCNVPDYKSVSHVRYFANEDEVAQRYGSRFDDFRCDRVRNVSGSSEFLFDGIARPAS